MVRVNAIKAYTRAKSKRQKSKAESQKAILEAKKRYVQQLSNHAGIPIEHFYPKELPRERSRETASRSTDNSGHKKITDYFSVTKNLDLMHRVVKASKPITSTRFDPNGVEIITIYDSEHEDVDDNDNNNNIATTINNNDSGSSSINDDADNGTTKFNNENLNSSMNSSFWGSSFDSNHCDQSALPVQNKAYQDVKPPPCKLDLSNLGTSFEDLKLKLHIDEDIEIVDMLPPIPLRNHPVFQLDE